MPLEKRRTLRCGITVLDVSAVPTFSHYSELYKHSDMAILQGLMYSSMSCVDGFLVQYI